MSISCLPMTSPKWANFGNFARKWKYYPIFLIFCILIHRVQVCSSTNFTYVFVHMITNIIFKNGTWAGMLNVSQLKNHWITHIFCFKTLIYQKKTFFMMLFLYDDVTVVIPFYTLIFNMTSTIFHLVFKACYKTYVARNA